MTLETNKNHITTYATTHNCKNNENCVVAIEHNQHVIYTDKMNMLFSVESDLFNAPVTCHSKLPLKQKIIFVKYYK